MSNETKDRREAGGRKQRDLSWRFRFCPGKWDAFLPYVHLLQLTAHVRKGLLKRGNNEKVRDVKRAVCCVSLLHLAGSILSAGTKRSSLPALIPSGLAGKWWKSMHWGVGLYVEDAWIYRRRTRSGRSQRPTLPDTSLLSRPHLEWKRTTVSSTSCQTHTVDEHKLIQRLLH